MNVDTADLLDSHDVALALGLSSHRAVSTYRTRYASFPEPVIEKGSGRCTLWLRRDIEDWVNEPEQVRSDYVLNVAGAIVGWEYGQMVDAARRLDSEPDAVAQVALLESMLVHARALIEFVAGRGRKDTDILPSQLLKSWTRPTRGDRKWLGEQKRMIDQHLSHITWARAKVWLDSTPQPIAWDYWQIVRDLTDRLRDFERAVAAEPGTVDLVTLRRKLRDAQALAGRFASQIKSTTTTDTTIVSTS